MRQEEMKNNEDFLAKGLLEEGANVGFSKSENAIEEMEKSQLFCVLFDRRHDSRMLAELQYAYVSKKQLVLIVERGLEDRARELKDAYPWARIYHFDEPRQLIDIGREVHQLARKGEL